jgi:hypothetical protein
MARHRACRHRNTTEHTETHRTREHAKAIDTTHAPRTPTDARDDDDDDDATTTNHDRRLVLPAWTRADTTHIYIS